MVDGSGQVEPAWEHDVELGEGCLPCGVAAAGGGASHLLAAEVEDLDQGLVGGEVPAVAGALAQLSVDVLDHARGVDDLADLRGEVEERDDQLPGIPPAP